jgi:hypothetical protein
LPKVPAACVGEGPRSACRPFTVQRQHRPLLLRYRHECESSNLLSIQQRDRVCGWAGHLQINISDYILWVTGLLTSITRSAQ